MPKKKTRPKTLHWEVIDAKRRKLLPKLAFVKKYGFYLAGGTGLALQMGHRTSVDFDFYTAKEFREPLFVKEFLQNVKGVRTEQKGWQTVFGSVGDIHFSFFYYPYRWIQPLVKTEWINILSVPDIAAMKLIAVAERGVYRDFIDLYFIAKAHGLDQIFRWTKKKFPHYELAACFQGLTYFKDAEEDRSARGRALRTFVSWGEVKSFLVRETHRLVKIWL